MRKKPPDKPYDIAAWKGTAGLVPHSFRHLR